METPYRDMPVAQPLHICEKCQNYIGWQSGDGTYVCRYPVGEIDLITGEQITNRRNARKHRDEVGKTCPDYMAKAATDFEVTESKVKEIALSVGKAVLILSLLIGPVILINIFS